ncbi:MAG: sulfatase [Acidobacteria bacterium]|nr:sulfatase [Acidobacteriota bacterium]
MKKFSTYTFAWLLLLSGACSRQPDRRPEDRDVPVVDLAQPAPANAAAPAPGKPRLNVLLIVFDDLNDWIEPLGGHPDAKTPEFNRLAKTALVFENAHADAPACNPSRTALLSGLRPSTTGVYLNGQPYLAALPGSYTLVEFFKAYGYRTMGAGKVFHTYGAGKNAWDEYARKGGDPEPEAEHQDHLFDEKHFAWGPVDASIGDMSDTRTAKTVAAWLQKPEKAPFFMAVGFHKPHLPWYVPKKLFERYPIDEVTLPVHIDHDLDDVPEIAQRLARTKEHLRIVRAKAWDDATQAYLASVTFSDLMLNTVMKALRRGPHADNTIVVITSDHGFHLGEKDHWGKYSLWRQATRIPLVMMVPGAKASGKTSPRPVTLVDLYPTLAELCGLPQPQNLDGTSFAPLFENPTQRWAHVALTNHRRGNYSVRNENWTYIRYSDGTEELYNLKKDPHEWENLAGSLSSGRMKRILGEHIPKSDAPYAPYSFQPTDIKDTAEQMLRFFPAQKLMQEIQRAQDRRAKQQAAEPHP